MKPRYVNAARISNQVFPQSVVASAKYWIFSSFKPKTKKVNFMQITVELCKDFLLRRTWRRESERRKKQFSKILISFFCHHLRTVCALILAVTRWWCLYRARFNSIFMLIARRLNNNFHITLNLVVDSSFRRSLSFLLLYSENLNISHRIILIGRVRGGNSNSDEESITNNLCEKQ